MSTEEIDKLKKHKLCSSCIGEPFLKDHVSSKGKSRKCSYCKRKEKSLSMEDLSQLIETAFEQHYYQTSSEPTDYDYMLIKEFNDDWEREGEPVVDAIMNAAEIPEQAASDIQRILEEKYFDFDSAAMHIEDEFSSESYYEGRETNDFKWQHEWKKFEHMLKTESRFFNLSASRLLKSVFCDIATMRTRDGRALIVDAGPNEELSSVFRARSFQLGENLQVALARPDKHLGSPPSADASPGRMNAHGISVFYGANNPEVALAEIRPPVGCQVAIARFDIIRPIRLLDLTALGAIASKGSIFDPNFIGQLERKKFLRDLSNRITIPVMPDHEQFEYLATQAIADFLSTECETPLDGIIFPSVQTGEGALNIVLFHKAACVEAIELPKGAEITVDLAQQDEDGWHPEYTVYEKVPPKEKEAKKQDSQDFEDIIPLLYSEQRTPTLKISLDSIHIHIVNSVKFSTEQFEVSRHRWETT